MASERLIAAQGSPAATVETDLYTIPASSSFTGYAIVCNRGGITTFRVSVSLAGAATEDKDYLVYDKILNANAALDTKTFSAQAGAVVRVHAGTGDVSFTLTGLKQDA